MGAGQANCTRSPTASTRTCCCSCSADTTQCPPRSSTSRHQRRWARTSSPAARRSASGRRARARCYVCGDFNGWTRDDARRCWCSNDDGRWTGFVPGVTRRRQLHVLRRRRRRRRLQARSLRARAHQRLARPATASSASADTFPWQDAGWRHAGLPRPRHLPVPRRHVVRARPRERASPSSSTCWTASSTSRTSASTRSSRCRSSNSARRAAWATTAPTFSRPRWTTRSRTTSSRAIWRRVNRLLAQKGKSPLTRERAARRHQPAQGAGRPLPPLRHRRHPRRRLQPRRRATSTASTESSISSTAQPGSDQNDSLYFTDQDHAGPVFAFWNAGGAAVPDRQRAVLPRRVPRRRLPLRPGDASSTSRTSAIRLALLPGPELRRSTRQTRRRINIAEYWGPEPAVVRPPHEGGAGFDAELARRAAPARSAA